METKDWVTAILTIWSNTIATIALIVSIRKKKPTQRKPKAKRKR